MQARLAFEKWSAQPGLGDECERLAPQNSATTKKYFLTGNLAGKLSSSRSQLLACPLLKKNITLAFQKGVVKDWSTTPLWPNIDSCVNRVRGFCMVHAVQIPSFAIPFAASIVRERIGRYKIESGAPTRKHASAANGNPTSP
jgi:hypothetical protein